MVADAVARARLADAADLLRVFLCRAVGRCVVGRIRDVCQELSASFLGGRQLALEALKVCLDRLQLLDLLRGRLAFQLRLRPQLVDLRHELEPAPVRLHERVEIVRRALALRAPPATRQGSRARPERRSCAESMKAHAEAEALGGGTRSGTGRR